MDLSLNPFQRKDADNVKERTHRFVIDHKGISSVAFLFISWFVIRFVPFGWLDFIPFISARLMALILVGNALAFIPSRWASKRLKSFPVDYIAEVSVTDENQHIIKIYQYYEGQFLKDYSIEGSQPKNWKNKRGITVYLVNEIDRDSKTAKTGWYGEASDVEYLQNRDKIEANRLRNRKYARAGIKALQKLKTLADKIENRYVNDLQLKEIEKTSFDSDVIMEEIEDELPELSQSNDEEDGNLTASDILNDLNDGNEDVDAEINLSTSTSDKNE